MVTGQLTGQIKSNIQDLRSEAYNETTGRDKQNLQASSNFQGFILFFSEIFSHLNSLIIQHLLESMEVLEDSGLISLELMLKVVDQFDETVARLVSECEDQYTMVGDLAGFRLVRSRRALLVIGINHLIFIGSQRICICSG